LRFFDSLHFTTTRHRTRLEREKPGLLQLVLGRRHNNLVDIDDDDLTLLFYIVVAT
jgi:hypothetical protein